MSQIFKQWLKHQLDGLVNVQTSIVLTEPDLLVHLWSGVQVRVHLVNKALRTRQIRHALQEASGIGVGTLFLVHGSLVPTNGEQAVLDEWLRALHELTHEQVYVYYLAKNEPQIFPIHFEMLAGMAKHEVHYGPTVQLQRLRFYRASIKPRFIKGNWLVADFDTPAFWKANDYRYHRQQDHEAQRRAEGRSTHWYTWSTGQTWQSTNGGKEEQSTRRNEPTLNSYLEQCYARLGLTLGASKDDIKVAFRKLAIQVHPDTSSLPKEEAELRFKALTEAYEYIKSANNWS